MPKFHALLSIQILHRCVIQILVKTEGPALKDAVILHATAVTICLAICAKTVSRELPSQINLLGKKK